MHNTHQCSQRVFFVIWVKLISMSWYFYTRKVLSRCKNDDKSHSHWCVKIYYMSHRFSEIWKLFILPAELWKWTTNKMVEKYPISIWPDFLTINKYLNIIILCLMSCILEYWISAKNFQNKTYIWLCSCNSLSRMTNFIYSSAD